MSNMPTGAVIFLCTDIEGNTRPAASPPVAWQVVRQLIRPERALG